MSTEQKKKVTLGDNRVVIRDMTIRDAAVVEYFSNLSESDDLDRKLESALRTGVAAIQSIGTASNVKYVEKAFENLDEKMKTKLEQAFGEEGKFSTLLEKHFGEDGKVVKDMFDPEREGTPLYSLREELVEGLDAIQRQLEIDEAVEEEAEHGTQKGLDFEAQCEDDLGWIADIHSDKLEATGNEAGRITRSKKGDFVITVSDIGKRMVFEMKDRKNLTIKDIQKELATAMENRDAEYGILVAKNISSLPKEAGWFNEYDGKYLVCAMEGEDGSFLSDGGMLHIAYKWARSRLRADTEKGAELDPAFVMEKARTIKKKIADLKAIRLQCKNIENATEAIDGKSKEIEVSIKEDLAEMADSLTQKRG